MAFASLTACPVCDTALIAPTILVQTEAGPQWALAEMLKSPVKAGGAGTQIAFM